MPKTLTLRALNDDLAFVETELAALTDPYDTVRVMWEKRREAIQDEISRIERQDENHARVALMFNGSPVVGSQEIKLDFAAKVLENYQAIVASLAAERAGTELGARGRLPSTFSSKLFIRDMVRGSVGFLVEEREPEQPELVPSALKDSVEEATRILADLSGREFKEFESRIQELSPRTIGAIKKMAKVLHDAGAETKIIDDQRELALNYDKTTSLHARLNEVEYAERSESRSGTLLGLFPERAQYEFRPDGDLPVFYGPVSESFDERYVSDPEFARSILLQPLTASFLVSTVIRAGRIQKEDWILEGVTLKSR